MIMHVVILHLIVIIPMGFANAMFIFDLVQGTTIPAQKSATLFLGMSLWIPSLTPSHSLLWIHNRGILCRIIDVRKDYSKPSMLLTNATQEADRSFYSSVLAGLNAELQQLGTVAVGTMEDSIDNGE